MSYLTADIAQLVSKGFSVTFEPDAMGKARVKLSKDNCHAACAWQADMSDLNNVSDERLDTTAAVAVMVARREFYEVFVEKK